VKTYFCPEVLPEDRGQSPTIFGGNCNKNAPSIFGGKSNEKTRA